MMFFADEKQVFDREVNLPDEYCEGFGVLSYITPAEYYRRDFHYIGTHCYHESGNLVHVVRCDDSAADDFGMYYYTLHI